MAKLIYSAITSLDGYVADKDGNFDWGEPDEEVHSFINDLERRVGTHLYGRRMYEVMIAWEAWDVTEEPPPIQDYARIWRAADKLVFSRTLSVASSEKTRIERDFDATAIRVMKDQAASDISIGGPELAAHALKAGLVDECHLFVAPVVVGGGNRAFRDGLSLELELLEERSFANDMVHLHYRVGQTGS